MGVQLMATPSPKRTAKQRERIASAESVGYKWQWDSEYRLKFGRGRHAPSVSACISVLRGNVIGSDRSMVVYPDGSAVTAAWQNGRVMFNRTKMSNAMAAMRDGPVDEDDHFMESQQR